MILASRMYEGNIVELDWNEDTDESIVRVISEFGESIATASTRQEAADLYLHTSLYADHFALNAPNWIDRVNEYGFHTV